LLGNTTCIIEAVDLVEQCYHTKDMLWSRETPVGAL